MNKGHRSRPRLSDRNPQFPLLLLAASLALLPRAAFAQETVTTSDRDRVMLWTAIAVVLSLLACAVGYAYRRMHGMDHPTPDELEMMGGHGHGDDAHGHDGHAEGDYASDAQHDGDGADLAVPPHAEAEHGAAARH